MVQKSHFQNRDIKSSPFEHQSLNRTSATLGFQGWIRTNIIVLELDVIYGTGHPVGTDEDTIWHPVLELGALLKESARMGKTSSSASIDVSKSIVTN